MPDGQRYTTETARDAAARDDLAEWVAGFLRSPGSDNAGLAKLLSDPRRSWLGPVKLPLDRLERLAGPPGSLVLVEVDEEYWRDDVDDLAGRFEAGKDVAPVMVSFADDTLSLEDGNHRVEAVGRAGEEHVWAVVAFENDAERDQFIARSEPGGS